MSKMKESVIDIRCRQIANILEDIIGKDFFKIYLYINFVKYESYKITFCLSLQSNKEEILFCNDILRKQNNRLGHISDQMIVLYKRVNSLFCNYKQMYSVIGNTMLLVITYNRKFDIEVESRKFIDSKDFHHGLLAKIEEHK